MLLSAFMTTTALVVVDVDAGGTKAETDPARRARVAAAFIIVDLMWFGGVRWWRDLIDDV